MKCYACGEEEVIICSNCRNAFCEVHGDTEEEMCNECLRMEDEDLI